MPTLPAFPLDIVADNESDEWPEGYDENDEGFDASQALQDFQDFGSPSDYINF